MTSGFWATRRVSIPSLSRRSPQARSTRCLTRRCSGLATLAAELHFVRRCLVNEIRLGDHTDLRSRSPAHPSATPRTGRGLVAPRDLPALSESSRAFRTSGAAVSRATSSSSVPPSLALPQGPGHHFRHFASRACSDPRRVTASHLRARFLTGLHRGFLLSAA